MKRFSLTFIFFLFAIALMAQVPAGFSYQAVVRNNSGEIIAGKTVKFRFGILQNSSTGTPVYVETQSIATNNYGLANLVVGTGTKVSGNFNPAGWGDHAHFLKVELDPNNGNSFYHLGTVQLMAVPYAFHSQTVEEISNHSVTAPKLATMGASAGQVLTYTGAVWQPQTFASNPWQSSGSDIYFNAGKVGIGKNPGADLRQFQVLTGNNQAVAAVNNSAIYASIYAFNEGSGPAADFRNKIRIADGTQGAGKVLTSDGNGYTAWQTPGGGLMTIDATNKRVGINTTSPSATLDVEGTMQVGSFGKVFSEIREITGTTGATGGSTTINYPSGYTMANMRVLSFEINYNGNAWIGVGGNQTNTTVTPRLFYYLGSSIMLYYPAISNFQGKAFRMMVMQVQ